MSLTATPDKARGNGECGLLQVMQISPIRGDRSSVRVILSDGQRFDVPEQHIATFGVWKNSTLEAESVERLALEHRRRQCKVRAYRYATYKPRCTQQVRRKLEAEGYPSTDIDHALERLGEMGVVDDRQWALDFVRTTQKYRPQSSSLIRRKLVFHGISLDIIGELSALVQPQGSVDLDSALRLLKKREKRLRQMPVDSAKRRATTLLLRQGFRSGDTRQAVTMFFQDSNSEGSQSQD